MRRLVALSALLILAGLVLLLPSVPIWSLLATGSTDSSALSRLTSTGTDWTTIESLLGFGMVGVGLILEVFSLFSDVGGTVQSSPVSQAEKVGEKA